MQVDGLVVDYDGEKNIVMYEGIKQYPIGGMIAEYAHLQPSSLKKVILNYHNLDNIPSSGILSEFFTWFEKELEVKYGTVASLIITFEFINLIIEMQNVESYEKSEFFEVITEENAIGKFIFEGSGFNELGRKTIKQLLLSVYYYWALSYANFKFSFKMLASDEEFEEQQVLGFLSMYTENIDFQHIDFRITHYEGKFHSLYTIKTGFSLLLFEAAHCMDKNIKFKKCTNCGSYFIPEGRTDTIYCNFPSPQNKNKTCKDIGAQIKRANKEKNDITTKKYRKLYMKYKMITVRHPEDRTTKLKLEKLIEEGKVKRKCLNNGSITVDDYLKWLDSFN